MDNKNLKLLIALARTHRAVFDQLEKNIKSFDLNLSEFGVLEMLLHKGETPVQHIAEKILVTSGTITYVIDKLVKKELVKRVKCEKDQRITYVSLTEEGRELISGIFPEHVNFLNELFHSVNDKTKQSLIENLFELSGNI